MNVDRILVRLVGPALGYLTLAGLVTIAWVTG